MGADEWGEDRRMGWGQTLIFAASRKLTPTALRQCSSGKAKYIEKSLHSLSFVGQISVSSLGCVLAKQQ